MSDTWPLGENPCLIPSPIPSMISKADWITAHRLAVEEIRERHRPVLTQTEADQWECCHGCGDDWPCADAAILNRHGLTS